MNKKASVWYIILIVFIAVLVFFIFGYIGGIETQKIGAQCDIGFSSFCWKWTKVLIIESYP